MTAIKSVVFATDLSKASSRAFDAAIQMARVNNARLTIVHVLVPIVPFAPEQSFALSAWRDIEAQTRSWAESQLDRLAARARKLGVSPTTRVLEGEAVDAIRRAIRTSHANLLVIGTRGRRGVARLILGSVAQQLIATAPCPVLTVRSR
jgi:nucleotide-binding universal stress UspA family protein